MATIAETQRLRLRECELSDHEAIAAMVGDKDQMRFYPQRKTRDEAAAWIKRNISLYEEIGFGFWLVESITTAEFVGYCGIRPHDWLSEIEMGWHLKKTFWKQGLGTEAALSVRDLGFDRFGLDRLVALIDPENVASIRVAQKVGMHVEQPTVYDEFGSILYAVER